MNDPTQFNPLDKKNLGASVAEALLSRKPVPLGDHKPFIGAGIYAIYYVGSFPAYSLISQRNAKGRFEAPIYVGKAIPAGARKGGVRLDEKQTTRALYARLAEHADSISSTANLNIKDFFCRYLIVDDIWIPLGESLLIAKFAPIWNNIIEGFGNHDPGKGRHQGKRPIWDVLHPGRAWAMRCQERSETAEQLALAAKEYLRSTPIPPTVHFYAEQTRKPYKLS